MDPQRKHGVCLAASPVVSRPSSHCSLRDDRTDRPASSSTHEPYASMPHNQTAHSRTQRELTTFKGHKRNSNSAMTSSLGKHDDAAGDTQRTSPWRKSNDIFQVVPLDGEPMPSIRGTPVVKPISLYKKTADSGQDARARGTNLRPPFKFAGFVGTIASAFFFSLGVFCVKLMPLEDELPEKAKTIMFRGFSLMLWPAITIIVQGSTFMVRRDEIPLNLIRSVVGFFGSFGIYVAVQYITIAEASALTYSSPLWTCLLGYFLLRERLPVTLVAAFPLGAVALVLIAHPDLILNVQDEIVTELQRHNHGHLLAAPSPPPLAMPNQSTLHVENRSIDATFLHHRLNDSAILALDLAPEEETEMYLAQRWPGVLIGILTSLVLAVVNICLKFRKTTPIQTTTFYLGVATVLLSLAIQLALGFGSWPATWFEWALHLTLGLSAYVGQSLFQWSLLYESAGTLSVVRTSDIVFSFTWSTVFLNEDLLWTSVLGAALIVAVVALIMFNDQIEQRLPRRCRESATS